MHDKRTQENIRRNRGRRGAGIEMAMLLMVVAVALSGLLTSAAMMQIDKQKDSEEQLEQLKQRVVLDRIGRDFCSQQESYVLPLGVKGVITRTGCTDPECCIGCAECNEKYAESEEGNESNEGAEAEEDNGNSGGTEVTENTEGNGSTERPECCNDCECTIGCTQYTEISLVVYSDSASEEVVLTVVLANNQDGTYTVTEWSYGE